MTELVFKKKVFSVDIYGEKFELRKPTGIERQAVMEELNTLNEMRAAKKEMTGKEDYEVFRRFCEMLGLKEGVFATMYEDDQIELVGSLMEIKKK